MATHNDREYLVYVGTSTEGESASEGIYVYRMDPSSGALELESVAAGVDNPTHLAIHPLKRYLYAVNEVEEFRGEKGGAVSAFCIDPKAGELSFLNQQPTGGAGPCYVSVDQTGKFVFAANYSGGNLTVFPLQDDGRLGPATDLVQHQGSGLTPLPQDDPRTHSVVLDPTNRFAFAAALGFDRIAQYRLDLSQGKLVPNDEPWVLLAPGAGPRHFTFHPDGRYAYVINERGNSFTAFACDESRGTLEEIQSVSTLPADFDGTTHCADVHVSPSGRFLYGSNRGHDSIAIFAIDESTGALTFVDHEPTGGKMPWGFAIDPSGTLLLAANKDSSRVVGFRMDQDSGRLAPTGLVTEVPEPVCVRILSI